MKVLILSCNTGGGHNAAAQAIAEAIREHGDCAEVLDYLSLAGNGVSKLVGDGYVKVVKKAPAMFGMAYKLGMVVSRLMKKSPVYYANARMARYLEEYLQENPVDAIVMPHLYPAETITYMRRNGFALPLTVAVMTDYTCIPFWEETDCDYYITPHKKLHPEIIKRGIPAYKLKAFGIPVSRQCREDISREQARDMLGLEQEKKYFLLAAGSMGTKAIVHILELLLAMRSKKENLVVICGSNQKLKKKLQQKRNQKRQRKQVKSKPVPKKIPLPELLQMAAHRQGVQGQPPHPLLRFRQTDMWMALILAQAQVLGVLLPYRLQFPDTRSQQSIFWMLLLKLRHILLMLRV